MTLVHKGNIMKFTEGGFRDWGYETARERVRRGAARRRAVARDPDCPDGREIVVKDVIADAFLQQILTRPAEYDVIATMNLNGDYISDALAACVGGIGIAPGANINYDTGARDLRGHARHRPQVRRPGQGQPRLAHPLRRDDVPLPGLDRGRRPHRQRRGAHDRGPKTVTYDFERLMEGATLLSCSAFGQAIADHM